MDGEQCRNGCIAVKITQQPLYVVAECPHLRNGSGLNLTVIDRDEAHAYTALAELIRIELSFRSRSGGEAK